MNNENLLIHGLEHMRKAELHASEYYAVAKLDAVKHGQHDLAATYKAVGAVHGEFALKIEGRKEELEKEGGEGIFGEIFENVKEAFRSFVADLPVLFVEKETRPTPNLLTKIENDLIDGYHKLQDKADEKTKGILDEALQASHRHIESLSHF